MFTFYINAIKMMKFIWPRQEHNDKKSDKNDENEEGNII